MVSQYNRLILDLVCIVNVVCLFLILPVEAIENRKYKLLEDIKGSIQLRRNSQKLSFFSTEKRGE